MPLTPTRKLKRGVTVGNSLALVTDSSGRAATGATTAAEIGYVAGVTSAVQTQMDARLPLAGGTMTGQLNFSGTNHAGIKLISLTTTQRDALTAANGMMVYNTTTAKVQRYESGAWMDGSLTVWTESGGTYSGDAFTKLTPLSGTNVGAVIQPKGTGAFQLQESDGTVAGGNNRGDYAVDLQMERSAASQVASGANSFACGKHSTASGAGSVVMGSGLATGGGAVALHANATGDASFAAASGTASGTYAVAFGPGSDADLDGKLAIGAFTGSGQSQCGIFVITCSTLDATQNELRWDGSTGDACVLRNNSTFAFSILIVARRTDADGENDAWEFKGLIHRDANAASTTLDALQANQIGSSAWSVDVDAGTSNGSLRVRVTGAAAKTIRWVATIHTTEVAE